MILAFSESVSISCCRVSVEDRIRPLYSSVPSAGSRTCWVCDRSRGLALPRVTCRRRRSGHSCDVVRVRLQRDVDVLALSAMVAHRGISVCPFADSLVASSASSGKKIAAWLKNRALDARFQLLLSIILIIRINKYYRDLIITSIHSEYLVAVPLNCNLNQLLTRICKENNIDYSR